MDKAEGKNTKIEEQPAGDEVIRCEKLTKRYHDGNILAVDQLDMKVHHGEIFGLLGPERRRQNDNRGNAHHTGRADRRQGSGGRY